VRPEEAPTGVHFTGISAVTQNITHSSGDRPPVLIEGTGVTVLPSNMIVTFKSYAFWLLLVA
jgi:hypothetical protein